MRRAIVAVIAGGTLLTAAACDSDTKTSADPVATRSATPSAAPSSAPPSSPAPDYSTSTALVCGRLQTVYQGELKDFGAAMGKLITYREAKQSTEAKQAENGAADELKAAGAKIRKETAAATNPEFQAAGATSAAKFELGAKDRKYINKVKTLKDLNSTIEAQFTEWLTPVAGFCPAS